MIKCPDQIDQAEETNQFFLSMAISIARKNKDIEIFNGRCLNCNTESEQRFCDIECRDDYQEFKKKSNFNLSANGK